MRHRWVLDHWLTQEATRLVHRCGRCGAYEYLEGPGWWRLSTSFQYTGAPSTQTCEEETAASILES